MMDFDFGAGGQLARVSTPAADAILGVPIPVLDHGFVRLVDYMGDDAAIVQSARVSYGEGTTKKQDDDALIDYLFRHQHMSPFEMIEIKFHIKLPIFVERQLSRHRTSSQNQESARYSVMSEDTYVPDYDQLLRQSDTNKQGSADELVRDPWLTRQHLLNHDSTVNELYELLNQIGLTRERSRLVKTVASYTQLYWKQNLRNLFHLLNLRLDSHAQWEIREFARAIEMIVMRVAPVAHAAFVEHQRDAVTLSATERAILKRMLAESTASPSREMAPLEGKRRKAEFRAKMGL